MSHKPVAFLDSLRAGLVIGLVTGFVESGVLALRLMGNFINMSSQVFWLAPLVDGLVFSGFAGVLALLSRRLPRMITRRVLWGVLLFIAAFVVVVYLARLHRAAAVLIGLGVAIQLSRILVRMPRLDHMTRIAAIGLGVTVPVMATGFLLGPLVAEWRALRRPGPAAEMPSVLLIILDTVRARNLSLYGYDRPTTPAITRFAGRGVVFEHALAPSSWTLPSHSVMFTGRLPFRLASSWEVPLEKSPTTLAEALGRLGYVTAGIVANTRYCGWETGLSRGFDHYEDYAWTFGEALLSSRLTSNLYESISGNFALTLRPRITAADINRRLFRWMERRDSTRPYFVFLNYFDAHANYSAPEPFRSRFASVAKLPRTDRNVRLTPEQVKPHMDIYDAAIAYLDSQVGQMLDSLERRGLLHNTIVIITADHGEEFAEHGVNDHGTSLYRPALEIPLVVVYPGRVPAGSRVPVPVSTRDLAATIVELVHAPGLGFEGTSLARYWSASPGQDASAPVVSHERKLIRQAEWFPASRGDMFALEMNGYHYIKTEGDVPEELYDFERDPLELHDLAQSPEGARLLPGFRLALQKLRNGEPLAVH